MGILPAKNVPHYTGKCCIGWNNDKYLHATPIHIDMIDGKIWIQYDDTEEGIANDLIAAGIPQEDIILGFRHPRIRPFTNFAVS
ncbi:MAG: XisI protein [Sphaerospermopsis sp. SIO1G2]|nr:XisI protein [Sphaerospermopsis sp. SIO1G2]